MTTGSPQHNFPETGQASQREKNTFRVGLWTGILFILISIVSTVSTIQTGLYAFGGIILTTTIAAISFTSAYLARRGKANIGVAVLISSILLISLFMPFFAKGQGFSLGVITVVVVSGIARFTLTNQWAARTTFASIAIGLVIILVDAFLPNLGIPTDPQVTNIIAAVLGIVYTVFTLWRIGTYPLRTKLIIAFVIVTLVPIVVLSVVNNTTTRNILTQQADANLSRLADETSLRIDTYISSQLDIVRTEAQQPTLANFLQSPSFNRAETEAVALRTLLTFTRKDPVFILSYSLLDMRGRNVLGTDQSQIGQDESQYEYFKSPLFLGLPYSSNLIFKSAYPTIYFTAPVRNENGSMVGILRAEYNAIVFQNILQSTATELQAGQKILLVDRGTLVRIAATEERDEIYRSFKSISPQQVIALQAQQKLQPGIYTKVLSPSFEYTKGIENIASQPTFTLPAEGRGGNTVVTGSLVSTQPWVVTAQQPENAIYSQAESQARANLLWSVGLTAFALVAALSMAQIVSRPVISLAKIAEEIIQGNLSARANITTDDEIGRLSRIFNTMTTQISQTLAGLEQRVEERTTALQTANEQSAQRARQLQSIADVSKIITREQSIDKLLPLITDVVSERFGYYHVGIFLMDENRRAAVLQASNSLGGQKMVANGHRLMLGTGSIVGYVALIGKPRIALDVGEDAVFFNNPNLPETHSEMALPLVVRGTTIGIIDIQSKQSGAFIQEDVDILSILADQVAIAIENARLFRQTQTALEESQAIVQTYLRQEWSTLSRKQSTLGYLHTGTGGKALAAPMQSDEVEQAIRRGAVVRRERNIDSDTGPALAIPIVLGEQTIGAIRIQSPDQNRDWSPEEINLLRSISERIGLALDNARLVASSQRRASKERTIGEISTKISAATDMDTILQTAVQEIGRALSGADVVIQLQESQEE
jgi:GAF domain-containing protein/HAMP domain-containing protein